ncbi:MAG: NAD(P)-binding domain-containing protein [Candidatus Binatia bacterium]
MIKLTVLTDTATGKTFTSSGEPIVIGRTNVCTVVLNDSAVSRRHSSIERRGNDYVLQDLQSANGTFVNSPGNRVESHILQDGDEILLGKSRIRVEIPVADEEEAATRIYAPQASPESDADSETRVQASAATAPTPPPPPPAATSTEGELTAVHQPDIPIVVTIVSGPNRGMVYSPSRDVFTIGRGKTCDIVVNDSTASRTHATIKREGGRYRLYDENSVNGTYLRTPQNRVYHTDLADGDIFFIGQNQFRVEISLGAHASTGSDEATRISGTIAGKSFSFNLNALGGGTRAGHGEDATRVALPSTPPPPPEDATRFVPAPGAATPTDEATHIASAPVVAGPTVSLRVVAGNDVGTVFTPPPGTSRITLGRGEQASFRLQDRGTSRIHCAIEMSPAGCFLVDDSSLNGTFINQNPNRISRVALTGGEEITLGETRIQVEVTWPEGMAPVGAGKGEDATSFVAPPPVVAPSTAPPEASVPVEVVEQEPAKENVRSRSAAFKDRLATIAKQNGVTLRPFSIPGTPRQWATIALMLIAALSSYGFAVLGRTAYFAGGPISESHAKLEQQCATCHPTWGIPEVNATCVTTDCHANVLQVKGTERDDCVSCHTEHRGREFAISGGKDQCWSCHKPGMNVRAYATRPMQAYHDQVFTMAEQLVPRAGKIPTQNVQPVALQGARESWLKSHDAQPIGLKYAHTLHAQQVLEKNQKQENCFDCHVGLLDGEFAPFPTHAQCIDCHAEVADRDPQVAKANASEKCLLCHTQQDGGVAKIQRTINYVVFRHKDHGQGIACTQCHASIIGETEYRPVVRSAALYPMPMDACFTCHQETQATTQCLDCHRQHHSYPSTTELVQGWLGGLPLSAVLLTIVGFVGAAGAYTYFDMRLARKWLTSLEAETASQADGAASAAGGEGAAGGGPGSAGGAEAIPPPTPAESGLFPYPTVDTDACLPCGSCIDSCPGKVLALSHVTHKASVVNPDACRSLSDGCTLCHEICPTGAIRISPVPIVRKFERPNIDPNSESNNLPGIFLGGELLGNALIKKVVNQGGQIVRYIDTRKPRVAEAQYDIIIVGAGPCGLAAGLEAKERGLRHLILERESLANTIQNYPRDKAVLAEPVQMAVYGLLPMEDATKEELVALWENIVRKADLKVNTYEEVTAVNKSGNLLTVTTTKGSYQAPYVILALGARGNPRKIGVAGEDLPKVSYNLNDPAEWQGKHVLVVGGGDSAIEAAVAISKQPGSTVTLSYRSGAFSRAASRNVEAVKAQEQAGRIKVILNSNVTKIEEKRVSLKEGDKVHEIENDAIFVLIGADPPKGWLEKMGLKYVTIEKTI